MKLAISQIVLGTLIAVSALLDTIYGSPSIFRVPTFNVEVQQLKQRLQSAF